MISHVISGKDNTQINELLSPFDEEMRKLSVLETGSPEYGVTRNYLDWATSVPWGVLSEDNLELAHAREQTRARLRGLGAGVF